MQNLKSLMETHVRLRKARAAYRVPARVAERIGSGGHRDGGLIEEVDGAARGNTEPLRIWQVRFTAGVRAVGIQAGHSESFLRGLLALTPGLLLVASAAGYWVSRRALQPVDRIAATARSISIRNISERVPVSSSGDELQRLAETCNAMLDRLESSVNQIKRFTADASHELRGPIAFTRAVAEIALRNSSTDESSRAAFHDIINEAAKASVMLEEMLTLARTDSAPNSITRTPVDLALIVREMCFSAQPIAAQHGLTVSLAIAPHPATIFGDVAALKRLMWILLDNAIKYSRPNGTISVRLNIVAGQASLRIHDDGIGIDPADLPFIFDRFYRGDPSRSMVEGNGLGLAIAQWVAESHQAQLTEKSEPASGTEFHVAFPCLPALSGATAHLGKEEGTPPEFRVPAMNLRRTSSRIPN